MNHLPDTIRRDLLDASTPVGAVVWAIILLAVATALAIVARRSTRRLESHLSDTTGLRFVGAFVQALAYFGCFILYAHLVPELRALGTALLASVSVVSVVLGFAAQSTLSNLFAGLSLVLYRPFRVGDHVQLNTPKGLTTATVERVVLGYTVLRDTENSEVIVPNSVMVSSVVIRVETGRT